MSIRCRDQHKAVIIEALRRARYKFPGRQKIIVSKKWGFTPLDRADYEELKANKQVINDGAYVQVCCDIFFLTLGRVGMAWVMAGNRGGNTEGREGCRNAEAGWRWSRGSINCSKGCNISGAGFVRVNSFLERALGHGCRTMETGRRDRLVYQQITPQENDS
jgi:hypothetical protein